jgi:hypothetical protein
VNQQKIIKESRTIAYEAKKMTHHDTLWVEHSLNLLHDFYRLGRLRIVDVWRLHNAETVLSGDGTLVIRCGRQAGIRSFSIAPKLDVRVTYRPIDISKALAPLLRACPSFQRLR